MLKGSQISEVGESPEYVRISLAAAITLGFYPGRFLGMQSSILLIFC